MNFDLSEFLDSLSGLTRSAASRLIQGKLDELDKFNRRTKPTSGRAATFEHRTFTREHEFLSHLLYDVQVGGRSQVKKADREEIDEVLKSLKHDAPLKIIKKNDS